MPEMLDFSVNLALLTSGNFSGIPQANSALTKLQATTSKLQATSSKITAYQKQSAYLSTLGEKVSKAREKVQQLSEAMSKGGTVSAKLSREHEQALKQQTALEDSYSKQKQKLDDLAQSLNSAGINSSNLTSKQQELQSQLDRNAQAQERLISAQQRYSDLQSQLSWGNIKGDVMTSAALIKTFQKPIEIDMNFEQAMANVRAVMNSSQEDFEELRNQALELGRTTMFSASQAAASQENLARAGYSKQEIIDTMPALLSMSAAEGMDLAQGADILASIQGGMNLKATDSARIADVLAYTSANSKLSIAGLGEALKQVAPLAAGQNISLEQLSSYVGTLANKGFDMSTIGTGLRNTILRVTNETTAAKLNKLGVATKTREGALVELPEIMRQLNNKLAKKGTAEQAAILGDIFGKQTVSLAQAFMQAAASGEADDFTRRVQTDNKGSAAQMERLRNDSLKGDVTALSSAWEGLMITIGQALEPINRFVTQTLTIGIQKVTQFMNENKTLCDIAIRVGYAFAAWKVLRTVGKYAGVLMKLPGAYLETVRAARAAGDVMQSFGLITKANTAIQWLWNAALDANPIGAVILAITALIAAAAALYYYWDDISVWGGNAAEFCKDKWQSFRDWLHNFDAHEFFSGIRQGANDCVAALKEGFKGFTEWLANPNWADVQGFWDSLQEGGNSYYSFLQEYFQATVDFANLLRSPFVEFHDWLTQDLGLPDVWGMFYQKAA